MNRIGTSLWRWIPTVAVAFAACAASASDISFPANAAYLPVVEPQGMTFEPLPISQQPDQQFIFEERPEPAPTGDFFPAVPTVVLPVESEWYTRGEYYRWNTRNIKTGVNYEVEKGTLMTLGYERRIGAERFRAELFGGSMQYRATSDPTASLISHTGYFGGRGECEYLWSISSDYWPPPVFFVGIGTRIWGRNVHDGTDVLGVPTEGFHQIWWTVYPYAGLEKKWLLNGGGELFASGRLGCTAVTYLYTPEYFFYDNLPAFYPKPNITAQIEAGWRRNRLSCSVYFETMTWQKSTTVHLHGDPSDDRYFWESSQMFTTGMQLGWEF